MYKDPGKKFLSDLKLYSDYLKWDSDKNRYETWEEAMDEILAQHRLKYKGKDVEQELDYIRPFLYNRKILASQRNLQFRAAEIFKHNSRLFNCSSTYIDRPEVFKQIMYLLLSGCGVGFSVQKRHIVKLPSIKKRSNQTITYVVPDSIEGWSLALDELMMSYFNGTEKIRFDYSLIRPKNSLIANRFLAPGHEPLKRSIEIIEGLIDSYLGDNTETKLHSVIVYDIICHASDAVLAAGLRRSALICLFDKDDEGMINSKTGDWYITHPQRGRSNNSAVLVRGEYTEEEYQFFAQRIKEFGEPGFLIVDDDRFCTNPCFPVDEKILTADGWRTFGELLNTNPIIHQDLRIKGEYNHGIEQWALTGHKGGTTALTQAYNVSKTGENQKVYKIELSCGREVKATGNHHFATNKGMQELLSLSIGDKLMVGVPDVPKVNFNSTDYKLGVLMGLCAGDGTLTEVTAILDIWDKGEEDYLIFQGYVKEALSGRVDLQNIGGGAKCDMSPKFKECIKTSNFTKLRLGSYALKKVFTQEGFLSKKDNYDWLFSKSKDLKAGFLSGLFFADGHCEGNLKSGTATVIISQSNKDALKVWQLIAQELGLFGVIRDSAPARYTMLPDGKGGKKEYYTKQSYRLSFGGFEMLNRWLSVVKTYSHKKEKINYLLDYIYKNKGIRKPNYLSKITNITLHSIEDVFCLKEDINRTLISGGIVARRCAEISFIPINPFNGNSCISFCNLNEISAKGINSLEEFLGRVKAAVLLGTMQCGYTEFPFLGKDTEELVSWESLLGISITGWFDNPELFNEDWLQKGAAYAKEVNAELAAKLGLNASARMTCVKPSGNASVILGTASGIHPAHSRNYFRIMQLNKDNEVCKWLKENRPDMLEDSVWSANNTDYAVYVPITEDDGAIFKSDISGIAFLDKVKLVQQNWVIPGTNKDLGYSESITHNVSNTVLVDDWEETFEYVHKNNKYFCGISFIPNTGDKDYKQAPFTSVLMAEELLEKYGNASIFASGLIVDGLHYFNGDLWRACDHIINRSLLFKGSRDECLLQKDWVRRAKKFAKNYFKGSIENTIYCLKDVHLFHKWNIVKRDFKPVDFSEILTEPTYQDVSDYAAIACSGGSCEI